jgi:hypothetical protein
MNDVSERLNSLASDCICAPDSPSASNTTASGLPVKGVAVKTSTISYASVPTAASLVTSTESSTDLYPDLP